MKTRIWRQRSVLASAVMVLAAMLTPGMAVHAQQEMFTFAGTGNDGDNGDGGPANQARLNKPTKILFDASGNMLISDYANHAVRLVDTSMPPNITTIAGTLGTAGADVDGDAPTSTALNGVIAVERSTATASSTSSSSSTTSYDVLTRLT